MFNVTLGWNHLLNKKLGVEVPWYPTYECGDIHQTPFVKGEYYSPNVSSTKSIGHPYARDAEGMTYDCSGPGALLFVPHDGHSVDAIRTKPFEDLMRERVALWFDWSKKNKFDVKRMDDLILVTGCTLVSSWAAAAFLGRSGAAEVSLVERPHQNGTRIEFNSIRGDVARHCSRFYQSNSSHDQCIFIRGFRAKRRLFRTVVIQAAAEPLPGDPDVNFVPRARGFVPGAVLQARDSVITSVRRSRAPSSHGTSPSRLYPFIPPTPRSPTPPRSRSPSRSPTPPSYRSPSRSPTPPPPRSPSRPSRSHSPSRPSPSRPSPSLPYPSPPSPLRVELSPLLYTTEAHSPQPFNQTPFRSLGLDLGETYSTEDELRHT